MAKKVAVTPEDIIADIRAGRLANLYILMGEEPYYIDKITEALEQYVVHPDDRDFDMNTYYGADADLGEVEAACRQYPMMGDYRLVLLKEAQGLHNAKTALEKLENYVSRPSETTVFAITYKGGVINATSKLMKGANASGATILKTAELQESQIPVLVRQYCSGKRVNITDKALIMLIQHVGTSLSTLFGEIDKMMVAAGAQSPIMIDDTLVEQVVGISKKYNNFEFCKALLAKDYAKVMTIIDTFGRNPTKNSTLPLTAFLLGQFTKLLIATLTPDKSDFGLMKALDMKSTFALKDIRLGLAHYTTGQCLEVIHALREFDTKSKGVESNQKEHELLKDFAFRAMTC